MICYYGKHYGAYFHTSKWLEDWEKIKERIIKGHYQPSILFYEKIEDVQLNIQELLHITASICKFQRIEMTQLLL